MRSSSTATVERAAPKQCERRGHVRHALELAVALGALPCVLRGLGYAANCGTLILGYLVGYLATMIPIPAGIGVLEGGLVGTLVLYGAPPAQSAAAVLIYHAIAFWIPSLGGLAAPTPRCFRIPHAHAGVATRARDHRSKQPLRRDPFA